MGVKQAEASHCRSSRLTRSCAPVTASWRFSSISPTRTLASDKVRFVSSSATRASVRPSSSGAILRLAWSAIAASMRRCFRVPAAPSCGVRHPLQDRCGQARRCLQSSGPPDHRRIRLFGRQFPGQEMRLPRNCSRTSCGEPNSLAARGCRQDPAGAVFAGRRDGQLPGEGNPGLQMAPGDACERQGAAVAAAFERRIGTAAACAADSGAAATALVSGMYVILASGENHRRRNQAKRQTARLLRQPISTPRSPRRDRAGSRKGWAPTRASVMELPRLTMCEPTSHHAASSRSSRSTMPATALATRGIFTSKSRSWRQRRMLSSSRLNFAISMSISPTIAFDSGAGPTARSNSQAERTAACSFADTSGRLRRRSRSRWRACRRRRRSAWRARPCER